MESSESIRHEPPAGINDAPVPIALSFVGGGAFDKDTNERLRWLRENDPVYWSEVDNLWIITTFADVTYVSKHQEIFTSAKGVRPGNPVKLSLIDEPEPRHNTLRKLINQGFTPRMVRKLEEVFEELVTTTLDKIAQNGKCDFVTDIAVPLPLRMIAEMMGIADRDFDKFSQWSDDMIAAEGHLEDQKVMERAALAFMAYAEHLTVIIEDRKKNPQDDLVTILASAGDAGMLQKLDSDVASLTGNQGAEHEALVTNELLMLLVVLMVAGNETTRNGLSGGMELLIQNPEARQRLIDDPSKITIAIEEMLRLVTPVRSFSRTVLEDTELNGKQLKKDDLVLLIYSSANRDASEFTDPDTFDIDRNPTHLAFGVGSHFCLGSSLARMEMRVTFTNLLKRLPDMQFANGGATLENNPLVRTCSKMEVTYTPESKPS